MCFRPAGAEMPEPDCPECGRRIHLVEGVELRECPYCKADLTQFINQNAPGAPGAPRPPGAPGAPKAPGAPGAPGVPKTPPSAPKPPSA